MAIIIISSFTRTFLQCISVSHDSIYPMVYMYRVASVQDFTRCQTMRYSFMEANEVEHGR